MALLPGLNQGAWQDPLYFCQGAWQAYGATAAADDYGAMLMRIPFTSPVMMFDLDEGL